MSTTNCPLSSFATPDGASIRYRDTGSGKSVILLHGWGASGAFFARQMALADRGLRLIVPDQRGHGSSHDVSRPLTIGLLASDLRELTRHLGLREFSLVGWSMGAMVAWDYVRTWGMAGLDKLTVIDMTAKIVTDDAWAHGLNGDYPAACVERTAHSVRSNWEKTAQSSAARLFARNAPVDPALLERFTALMLANRPEGLAQLWSDMARQDYRGVLPSLGPKCQFIYGAQSRLYSPEVSLHLARLAGTPHVSAVADAGHALQWERPLAFEQELLAHLEQ